MHAQLIVDARNATGESPVWDADEQALYWVDIPAGQLHRWRLADQTVTHWQAPQMLACIARHPQGGWIAGLETGIFHLVAGADGQLDSTLLASVDHALQGMRFNDGRCDRQGRFWAGSMLLDMAAAQPVGALYRYTGEPSPVVPALSGFIVPNGLAFSPDGRTMYVSDSHPDVQKIWSWDYDVDTGTPHGRRLFVDMKEYPGRPDGAAIDVDGGYWICANDAGLVHRFTPAGKLDRSLAVPVKKPTMCAFGGPNLDTLFVASIRPGGDLLDQPLAGGVFALQPGVQGLPEPGFSPR